MKPLVIYIKDKKIELTREEFEVYLKDAYNAGYSDGYAASKSWWNNPTITWTTNPNKTNDPIYDPYKITCEAYNAVGE